MIVASFVVSVVAVILAGYAVYFSREQTRIDRGRRAEEVADRQEAETTAKAASIRVTAAPREANSSRAMMITNDGKAAARNVRLAIEPADSMNRLPVRTEPIEDFADVPAGRRLYLEVMLMDQTSKAFRVTASWDDDNGHQQGASDLVQF